MAFPEDDIHVVDDTTANAIRAQIIDDIWISAGTLPTRLADAVDEDEVYSGLISAVAGASRADRYAITTDGEGANDDLVEPWLFVPTTPNNRLLIVGLGHSNTAVSGLDLMIREGVRQGNHVLVIPMPDGGTSGHDTLGGQATGTFNPLAYWIEPAIVAINQFLDDYPSTERIICTGLSGGGWLTTMLAAIDPRIDISIPVAGSYPLAVRLDSGVNINDYGDWEQRLHGLTHNGSDQLEYLDLHLLACTGGRRQTQVNNQYDSCCFAGTRYTQYATELTAAAATIGGVWGFHLSSNHADHQAIEDVVRNVIAPFLNARGGA